MYSILQACNYDFIFLESRAVVHVDNLVRPKQRYSVRSIDTEHVEVLKKQFVKSTPCTILIGVLEDETSIGQLDLPGKASVEVIGGNHTRVALQELHREGRSSVTSVIMDIYSVKSGDEQLTKLGIEHNKIHEHARETTFQQHVELFRKIRSQKLLEKTEKGWSTKTTIGRWKDAVAYIMGIEVRNYWLLFRETLSWEGFEFLLRAKVSSINV